MKRSYVPMTVCVMDILPEMVFLASNLVPGNTVDDLVIVNEEWDD